MTPLPTVWSQLATCATTGSRSRRAAARNGTALAGCTFESTRPEHSRRIVSSSRARDVPSRAEEPPLHRALDRRPVRERAVAVGVEHPVRVPRLHPLGVEAVPVVQADRERVVAEPPVEPGVDAPRGHGRGARAGAVSSSPSSTGSPGTRSTHSAAASRGTRKTAARLPVEALAEPAARSPCRRRRGSRADRGGRPRCASVIERRTSRLCRLGGRRARRSALRATRRRGRGTGAPRRASRTRASPRRRRP